tara:strand:- start:445 stop:1584 length:1140 start_codon:yes stop_codon:yes gene_type:complete
MLNVNDFREAAEQGLLKRVVLGPFELFNYTQQTTVTGAWTPVTMEARGIVFQDGQVVCRPMRKFFNSHETGAGEVFAPQLALVKLDGTLINIWFDLSGEMHISTRGSLDNEYIDGAWKIVRQRNLEEMLSLHTDVTWSFEYTYPQSLFGFPSVIPHDMERLTLLNMRTRDGWEIDAALIPQYNVSLYPDSNHYYNLNVSDSGEGDIVERMVELAKHLPWSDEGWVLSVFDGTTNNRIKVKGGQYVAMHRVIHGMTPRAVADAWYAGMQNDLIEMLHEPHRSLLGEAFLRYNVECEAAESAVNTWVNSYLITAEDPTDRKSFVLQAQEELPNYWQLAITAQFSDHIPDYRMFVVKRLTGKNPRSFQLPVTDDVNANEEQA